MKKIFFYLLLSFSIIGCSAEVDLTDAINEIDNSDDSGDDDNSAYIEVASVTQNGQATIITADLIGTKSYWDNSGNTVGIFYEKGKTPELIDKNFVQSYIDDNNQIVISLRGLTPGATYYFRPYIASMEKEDIGEAYSYTIKPYEAPSVPCTLETGNLIDRGTTYSISGGNGNLVSVNKYLVEISTGFGMSSPRMTFQFLEKPQTGTYTTTDHSPFADPMEVYVYINKNGGSFYDNCAMFKDQSIYVTPIDNDNVLISFCDLNYTMQSVAMKVRGAFKARLW
jgi:hypothetical protein